MRRGIFMQWVRDHIHELAGLTACEIAQRFLDRHPGYSDSRTPIQSLGNSLAKSVREGNEPTIKTGDEDDYPLRYYPTWTP